VERPHQKECSRHWARSVSRRWRTSTTPTEIGGISQRLEGRRSRSRCIEEAALASQQQGHYLASSEAGEPASFTIKGTALFGLCRRKQHSKHRVVQGLAANPKGSTGWPGGPGAAGTLSTPRSGQGAGQGEGLAVQQLKAPSPNREHAPPVQGMKGIWPVEATQQGNWPHPGNPGTARFRRPKLKTAFWPMACAGPEIQPM